MAKEIPQRPIIKHNPNEHVFISEECRKIPQATEATYQRIENKRLKEYDQRQNKSWRMSPLEYIGHFVAVVCVIVFIYNLLK